MTTKKARIEHFRKILHGAEYFVPLDGDQFIEVLNLLAQHPSADEKIGCGVAHIYVRQNPMFPKQRSFWIHRVDGTETDFSYLLCIDGKDKSLRAWFNAACRFVIENQIIEFKQIAFHGSSGTIPCSLTGESVNWSTCHVDHEHPTFAELVTRFIEVHNISLSAEMFEKSDDGTCEVLFSDGELIRNWGAFHRQFAKLRIVSKTANLTRKRGAR